MHGAFAYGQAGMQPSAVKAQMLFNFASVVEWPVHYREPTDKIRFCSLEPDAEVVTQIKQLLMSELGNHHVLNPAVKQSDLPTCDILYVPEHAQPLFATLRFSLSNLPILTVGEGEGFLKDGGMICFTKRVKNLGVYAKETVGFQINPSQIKGRQLVVDPMLFELAEKIMEPAL